MHSHFNGRHPRTGTEKKTRRHSPGPAAHQIGDADLEGTGFGAASRHVGRGFRRQGGAWPGPSLICRLATWCDTCPRVARFSAPTATQIEVQGVARVIESTYATPRRLRHFRRSRHCAAPRRLRQPRCDVSLVQSRALLGLDAAPVTVEVHLANGLPSFTLVGLADVEVKEARERVRCAIQNSGLEFPNNKHCQSGTGRPAEGLGPIRSAHCLGHPRGQRAGGCEAPRRP